MQCIRCYLTIPFSEGLRSYRTRSTSSLQQININRSSLAGRVNCKVRSRMKVIIVILFILGISVGVAKGQRPRTHSMPGDRDSSSCAQEQRSISITFLTAPNGSPVHSLGSDQGVLDLGRLSYFSKVDVNGAEIQRPKESL